MTRRCDSCTLAVTRCLNVNLRFVVGCRAYTSPLTPDKTALCQLPIVLTPPSSRRFLQQDGITLCCATLQTRGGVRCPSRPFIFQGDGWRAAGRSCCQHVGYCPCGVSCRLSACTVDSLHLDMQYPAVVVVVEEYERFCWPTVMCPCLCQRVSGFQGTCLWIARWPLTLLLGPLIVSKAGILLLNTAYQLSFS